MVSGCGEDLSLRPETTNSIEQSQTLVGTPIPAAVTAAIDPSERVVHSSAIRLTESSARIWRVVTENTITGKIRKLTLDDAGAVVNMEAQRLALQKQQAATYGAMSDTLAQALAQKPTAAVKLRVTYKLDGPLPAKPDGSLETEGWKQYDEKVRAMVAAAGLKLEAFVKSLGGKLIEKGQSFPQVTVELAGGLALANLRFHPQVQTVRDMTIERKDSEPTAFVSNTDLKLAEAFHTQGYFGEGVKVGMIEYVEGSGCGMRQHLYFRFGMPSPTVHHRIQPASCSGDADCVDPCGANTGKCGIDGKCAGAHATEVAGMIGHGLLWYWWGAPFLDLYFANGFDDYSYANQLQWLTGNGAWIVNESYGHRDCGYASYRGDYYQSWYALQGLLPVKATGNRGQQCMADCRYADLCVGGYTYYNGAHSIYDGTSSENPASCRGLGGSGCDIELPHLVGHGENVTTTSADPTAYYTPSSRQGTSYAAPAIAGLAGLMVDRWPSMFHSKPEAIKAAMMTSATQSVHGAPISTHNPPDERDGAGIPNAERIESMMNNDYVQYRTLGEGDFNVDNEIYVVTVIPGAGKTLRAAISWTACPYEYAYWAQWTQLGVDLDLYIRRPNGSYVAYGSSYDQNWEVVEVPYTDAGSYDIVLKHYEWQNCQALNNKTNVGIAWDAR